jgi:hypothetical protein
VIPFCDQFPRLARLYGSFKIFPQSLKLSSLYLCGSLIFLAHRIPYIFSCITHNNGFKNWSINCLKQIVFRFQILQTTIIRCFLLFLGCTCRCSDHTIINKTPPSDPTNHRIEELMVEWSCLIPPWKLKMKLCN